MTSYLDKTWVNGFRNVGLERTVVPIVVKLDNKTGRDLLFNPLVHKFVILTRTGEQITPLDLSLQELVTVKQKHKRLSKLLFTSQRTVYDGANVAMVLPFPEELPPPDKWKVVIFENPFPKTRKIKTLPKGKLKRVK